MNVGILGLGLIGGSLARAYSKAEHQVFACDNDKSMVEFALLSGIIHGTMDDTSIPHCDLILLAIYTDGSASWLENNAHLISQHTLVMDCCGVKEAICSRCFPIAEKYDFTFVDLYSPLYDISIGEVHEGYTSDGGHLTHEGYTVVTDEITPVLHKLLGK